MSTSVLYVQNVQTDSTGQAYLTQAPNLPLQAALIVSGLRRKNVLKLLVRIARVCVFVKVEQPRTIVTRKILILLKQDKILDLNHDQ